MSLYKALSDASWISHFAFRQCGVYSRQSYWPMASQNLQHSHYSSMIPVLTASRCHALYEETVGKSRFLF